MSKTRRWCAIVNQNTRDPADAASGARSVSSISRAARPRCDTSPVTKTSTLGVYVVDDTRSSATMEPGGGLRFDHFGARFDQPLGASHRISPTRTISAARAQPWSTSPTTNSSVYFSYGTSFNPSAETLTLAASNQALGPERDHTYEVGGKINVLDGQLALTAAAFNTVKTNARITDPLSSGPADPGGDASASTAWSSAPRAISPRIGK